MDANTLNTLVKLKEKLNPVKEKCDIESDLILEDMQKGTDGEVLSETLRLGRIYARSIKLLAMQRRMYKKVKRALISLGLFKEEEIALDINEFVKMEGSAKAIIGPITYTRDIPLEYLTNLEFIWSDADFSKLFNSDWIKNLEVVFGKLTMGYISSPVNLNITADIADFSMTKGNLKLPNYKIALKDIILSSVCNLPLELVEGNIHITSDEEIDPNAFNGINSFSGVVYYEKSKRLVSEGQIYSLEDFLPQEKEYTYK